MSAAQQFLHAQQRGPYRTVNGVQYHHHALGFHAEDWSDFELHFRISGRIIVKKRSHIIVRMGPRVSIGYSSEYKRWEKAAAAELAAQWAAAGITAPIPAEVKLNLTVITWFENRSGIPDLSATLEGPADVLEAHKPTCREDCKRHSGVISNDKWIFGHVGSDRLLDPDDPHTELILRPHRPTSTKP